MTIQIQRDVTPAAILRWAKQYLADRSHFATGALFEGVGAPAEADRVCALGAIRKGWVVLSNDVDGSDTQRDWYEDVDEVVAEADRVLAECLDSEKLAGGATPIGVVYSTNDRSLVGYDKIIEGLECAVQKAAA